MKVRHAVQQDIPKIAEIHVKSWQTTYQGIINQDYLDGLKIEEREESWRRMSLEGTFVAEDAEGYLVLLLLENNVMRGIQHMMENFTRSIYCKRNRDQEQELL